MRFARVSRRMREMVYDDTRWVARLKSMGCWDETEARRRFEDMMRRRREAAERAAEPAPGLGTEGRFRGAIPPRISATLFDASVEEAKKRASEMRDDFETMKLGTPSPVPESTIALYEDPEALLQVMGSVKSVRGHAREEYAKIYGAMAPFYFDLGRAKTHTDPVLFKVFKDPERQAQMLSNLVVFAKSDWCQGWQQRETKLATMVGMFEAAVLREFEQGFAYWDVDGRMKRYATVLDTLNGGNAVVEFFVHKHPVFSDSDLEANSTDCINMAQADDITLDPSRRFLSTLSQKVDEQATVMDRIFPHPDKVYWVFLDKVREDVIMEYTVPLLDETHVRSTLSYLKAMSGLFQQVFHFFRTLIPPERTTEKLAEKAKELALKTFEPHLDLYLQEEFNYFMHQAENEVSQWEKKLSDQAASVEDFYMASFSNRQADKKDFLTTFKKVIMAPVSVLPTSLSLPLPLPRGASSRSANGASPRTRSPHPSRPETPVTGGKVMATITMPDKAPTDELAAKAALMTSRLEGMKSLFSIEVALSLVHKAKASLSRSAVFIELGGQAGGEAREQCENMFVALLRILGTRHVKPGFDKAVEHLSQYNPREVSKHDQAGVAPLVMFIELVNVGDLISQMIDVFYEQQLAGPKIADRNDFLDAAGLAKKKFEQMLDESVAAGLIKGIDVLMDEVEYICATTQTPTDYNPGGTDSDGNGNVNGATKSSKHQSPDVGPTETARRVRDLVASHTNMLVGSTEKSMLDVFNGEVGHRLFTGVCKHLKRQRVSTEGAVRVIADMNLYFDYVRSLRNKDLLPYFRALRELSQIYLIDARHHAKEMATIIADTDRFSGVFRAEEVYEYAERRADWYQVRKDVERAMYGLECCVM